MYVQLTEKQQCFRARLTSKPWRCGCTRPPNAFPWDSGEAEAAYRQWESDYTKRDANYRSCELIKEFGHMADIPSLRTIIDIHDEASRIASGAPLA